MNPEANNPGTAGLEAEPKARRDSGPVVGLVAALAIAAYAATYYLDKQSGDFRTDAYQPFTASLLKKWPDLGVTESKGKKLYNANCAQCHQQTGLGIPGQIPPLAASDWVLAEKPDRIIRIVMYGLQGPIQVSGKQFNAAMQAPALTDDQIMEVLNHIRSEWGNKAPEVTVEQVGAVRAEVGKRGQFTPPELLAIPVE